MFVFKRQVFSNHKRVCVLTHLTAIGCMNERLLPLVHKCNAVRCVCVSTGLHTQPFTERSLELIPLGKRLLWMINYRHLPYGLESENNSTRWTVGFDVHHMRCHFHRLFVFLVHQRRNVSAPVNWNVYSDPHNGPTSAWTNEDCLVPRFLLSFLIWLTLLISSTAHNSPSVCQRVLQQLW